MDTARSLLQTIGRYGCPSIILSDSGTEFRNELVDGICQYLGVVKSFTHPNSHQENAVSERFNQEIDRHLSHLTQERNAKYQWSDYLPLVQRIINTSVHSALKVSPHDLIFATNRLDTEFLNSVNKNIPKDMITYTKYIDQVLSNHERNLNTAIARDAKRKFNHMSKVSTKKPIIFRQGTLVLRMVPTSAITGKPSRKTRLDTKWLGPYVITSRHKDDKTYNLKHLATAQKTTAQVFELTQYIPELHGDDVVKSIFQVASRDNTNLDIFRVRHHKFISTRDKDADRLDTLFFLIEYRDSSTNDSRWVPWSSVKSQKIVQEYLRQHNLGYLIPKHLKRSKSIVKLDKERQDLISKAIQSHKKKLNIT
jgi:hypothetical protein